MVISVSDVRFNLILVHSPIFGHDTHLNKHKVLCGVSFLCIHITHTHTHIICDSWWPGVLLFLCHAHILLSLYLLFQSEVLFYPFFMSCHIKCHQWQRALYKLMNFWSHRSFFAAVNVFSTELFVYSYSFLHINKSSVGCVFFTSQVRCGFFY